MTKQQIGFHPMPLPVPDWHPLLDTERAEGTTLPPDDPLLDTERAEGTTLPPDDPLLRPLGAPIGYAPGRSPEPEPQPEPLPVPVSRENQIPRQLAALKVKISRAEYEGEAELLAELLEERSRLREELARITTTPETSHE